MAKVIATIGGTALVPGVSKNRRWYTRAVIAGAVAKAQERLESGGLPLTMLTHHAASDDSTRIVGKVTSVSLAEDGSARFTADIADTEHGRTIATLLDSSGGRAAFLRTVSIRGAWGGKVRRVTGPDGKAAEQGESLEWDGFDLTKDPGVPGAQIDTFAWATDGQEETTERVLITESVQEARVTVTETTAPAVPAAAPEGVREALAVFLGAIQEGEPPAISKRKSGLSGGGRVYADPGYQADKKQRYDITDKGHALTAWRYISQAAKAAKYTAPQLRNIKARIRAALKKFGVSVSAESAPGWGFMEPFQITEAVAELYGDPSRAGSWSVSASNGPVNLSLSSWGMDPADLDVILRAAADAACKALAALDPDMDGDVDVPGAGPGSDTDGDGGHETAPEAGPPALPGADDPAGAGNQETEDPAMGEDTTSTIQGGGDAPAAGLSQETLAAIGAAVAEGLKAALPAPSAAPATPAAPAADAQPPAAPAGTAETATVAAAVAETLRALGYTPGTAQPATPAAPTAPPPTPAGTAPAGGAANPEVVRAAVAEALKGLGLPAAQPPPPAAPAASGSDLAAQIRGMVTEAVQGLVATGQVQPDPHGLPGFTTEHAVPTGADGKEKSAADLRGLDEDSLVDYAGAALDQHVFGNRGKALHGTDGGLA